MLNYDHSFKYHAVVVKVQANLQQAKQKAEEALEKKAVSLSLFWWRVQSAGSLLT